LFGTPETCVAPRRNVVRPLRDARASREAISLRTLLRAQSLRGHNGTAGPPPNSRWTLSVASGMLGLRGSLVRFIRRRRCDGAVEAESPRRLSVRVGVHLCRDLPPLRRDHVGQLSAGRPGTCRVRVHPGARSSSEPAASRTSEEQ